jgi:hypothetical protein
MWSNPVRMWLSSRCRCFQVPVQMWPSPGADVGSSVQRVTLCSSRATTRRAATGMSACARPRPTTGRASRPALIHMHGLRHREIHRHIHKTYTSTSTHVYICFDVDIHAVPMGACTTATEDRPVPTAVQPATASSAMASRCDAAVGTLLSKVGAHPTPSLCWCQPACNIGCELMCACV